MVDEYEKMGTINTMDDASSDSSMVDEYLYRGR